MDYDSTSAVTHTANKPIVAVAQTDGKVSVTEGTFISPLIFGIFISTFGISISGPFISISGIFIFLSFLAPTVTSGIIL